jgi:ribosomal protein S1
MDSSVEAVEDRTNEIKNKMHFSGKVVKLSLAGAVVDIGVGKPAVLHISQLLAPTAEPIKRVEDVLQVGQVVDVWVKKVKDERTELTMIKPLDLDWRDLKKGMSVKGTVVRLEKFGAFVEIGAERPGLVHISELSHGYVRTVGEIVKEGDEIEAQVLDVNRRKKQIKLSLKALQPEPVKEEPVKLIENAQKEKAGRRRPQRGEEGSEEYAPVAAAPEPLPEPDPTAMELAMRAAMEKARGRKGQHSQADKNRRNRDFDREQEEILSRTLEHKVRTN